MPTPAPRATSRSASLLDELVKMQRAGLPPAVLNAFIQRWTVPYLTSVDDTLALRKLGAPTEVLEAYARRGAELRLQAHQRSTEQKGASDRSHVILLPVPVGLSRPELPELSRPEDFPSSETLRTWAEFNPLFYSLWPFGW